MPTVVSEETRLTKLERFASESYHDIAYRLRDVSTGRLGPVHGGRWHVHQKRYLAPWEIRYHELSAQTEEARENARLHVVTRDVHELQFELGEDITTPVLWGIGSRRGGKSRGLAKAKIPIQVCEWPHIGGEVIGPTYDKLQIMWRYVLQDLPSHWIEHYRADEHWIELVTGQRIKFISAHKPDSVIGEGVGWIDFDELQSIKETAYSLALPAVSDGGSAFQICGVGTPRMGEFKQRYERVRALERDGGAKIIHFTYRDNAFLETGKGTIFDIASSLIDPRKRQQELDAEFVSEEGLVYYRFDRQVHGKTEKEMQLLRAVDVTSTWMPGELDSELNEPRYLIGVDYGVGRNFAVIYKVVKVAGRIGLWAVAEAYGDRDYDIDQLADELVARKFYPAVICDDASGAKSKGGTRAEWHWEDLQVRHGSIVAEGGRKVFEVHHYSRNPHVADRINAVNALMGNCLDQISWWADIDACPRLVECLENQEYENGKPRRSKKGETSYHDMPDAAGYPCVYLFPAAPDFEREEKQRKAA